MLRTFAAAFALLFAVACGGSKGTPVEPAPLPGEGAEGVSDGDDESVPGEAPALSAEERTFVDRMVALAAEFFDTVSTGDGDCDQVAGAANAFLDQHGAEMKELSERIEKSPPATQAAASQELEKKLEPKMPALVNTLQSCEGHEGVLAAFERLQTL